MALTQIEEIKLLQARQSTADKIVRRFAAERIVYLILTTLSCLGLFYLIYYYILHGKLDTESALSFFGPTGIIGVSIAGVFRMFDKVISKVFPD
jgi:hypothetical protein